MEVIPLHDVRTPMLSSELERYRWLGVNTVEALGEVARQLKPGNSEQEIQNRIAMAMWKRGNLPDLDPGRVGPAAPSLPPCHADP